jgi:hypothetical protein
VLNGRRKLKWRLRSLLETAGIIWPRRLCLRVLGWRGLVLSPSVIVQGTRPEADPLPSRLQSPV